MRIKIFFGVLFLLMLNVAVLFAQPSEPCAGTDPDATCPLDTWVIIFAVVAFVFATIHLYRKRDGLNTIKNGEAY
jgi:hypothetical protein